MEGTQQNAVLNTRPCRVSASIFGCFVLKSKNGEIVSVTNRRARALLAMLCLAPDEPFDREFLSKLLWPGRFEAQAKASLRQCLLELVKLGTTLNCELLIVTRTQVTLLGHVVQTDLTELEKALSKRQYSVATELLMHIGARPLIDQMNFGVAFKEWLERYRLQTEQRVQAAVFSSLSELQRSGNIAEHERLLNAWKVRDPYAVNKMMDQPRDNKIRIAILPFQSLHDGPQHDYFAEGMVDEIITTLGQVPELMVAGRNSSFGLKDSSRPLPEIGRILGVGHLVVGSVQRQGNDVRINVRLIDGATGFETWGNRYKGSVEDIFALQERVATAVTSELNNVLGITLKTPASNQMTISHESYDFYLQGRALTKRMIGEGVLTAAIALFQKALKIDPNFAECWSAIAEANAYAIIFNQSTDKIALARSMAECATRAIELSPNQGLAMVMLGVYKWSQNDPVGALDLAFEAHRLEPNNPAVTARLGSFLSYCGRTRQALPYIAAAVQQDPLDGRHLWHLSSALLNIRDMEGARNAGLKMTAVGFPSLPLGVATAAAGEHELAVKLYGQSQLMTNSMMIALANTKGMTEQELDAYWDTASKGVCSGKEEDRLKYCQLLDYMYATLPEKTDNKIVLPAIWMGYAPMVFKTLGEQVTPANIVGLTSLWADIEPIRQIRLHPDFMTFANKIGLVAAWEKYGWPDLLTRPATLPSFN